MFIDVFINILWYDVSSQQSMEETATTTCCRNLILLHVAMDPLRIMRKAQSNPMASQDSC